MKPTEKIRSFITENLIGLDEEDSFLDSDNIFELGYVNSLFAMRLLNYIEREFKITIRNEEMELKNFSSVDAIVQLLNQK